MAQKNFSLSFVSDSQGIGEDEFSAIVQAEKNVNTALEAVNTAREKRENATTIFLKKIGAYNKNGKVTKAAKEMGPRFVTDWISQFFDSWPQVKRPGREPEPASYTNEAVKLLFEAAEYTAYCRAYNALAQAIKQEKSPKEPAAKEPAAKEPAAKEPAAKEPAVTATKKAILLQEKTTLQWVLEQISEADDLNDLKKTIEFALSRTEKRIKKAA